MRVFCLDLFVCLPVFIDLEPLGALDVPREWGIPGV